MITIAEYDFAIADGLNNWEIITARTAILAVQQYFKDSGVDAQVMPERSFEQAQLFAAKLTPNLRKELEKADSPTAAVNILQSSKNVESFATR